MEHIDPRGLKLNEAAALHTLENSEKLMGQLEQLLTPRPGERSNLEKILTLLEAVARSNAQILQGQENLDGRLAEIELQIAALNAFWTSPDLHLLIERLLVLTDILDPVADSLRRCESLRS